MESLVDYIINHSTYFLHDRVHSNTTQVNYLLFKLETRVQIAYKIILIAISGNFQWIVIKETFKFINAELITFTWNRKKKIKGG